MHPRPDPEPSPCGPRLPRHAPEDRVDRRRLRGPERALLRRARPHLSRELPGAEQGRTRVIQRRFNVGVPRAPVLEKASTRRDRSER